MKFLICFLIASSLAMAMAAPLAENEYEMLFTSFVKQHNKQYTPEEFFKRYNIFKTNMDAIVRHESNPARTFTLKMNKFGDLTNEEFRARYTGYNSNLRANRRTVNLTNTNIPASVDWNAAGKVTPVKDQGQCGSCWAFSSTGCIESAHAIATGQLISLSEQELVDCSGSYGNQGCNGGEMQQAFEFVQANGGLCTESDYPYQAQDGTCQSSSCTSAVTISGYNNVATNDENALAQAAAQQPISVAVEADGSNWQFYSCGVVTGACGTNLDHGVLVAGYGTENGVAYWYVKNSWGASWGENGYIKLQRNIASSSGMCGIAMDPSYATA